MVWQSSAEGKRHEEPFDQEIGYHVEEQTRVYIAEGMSPEEARRRAQIEFGGREQAETGDA